MNPAITVIKPEAIEARSFAIISEEFYAQTGRHHEEFPRAQFAVIQRVIHATGDFAFAAALKFHPLAIDTALRQLRGGCTVVTDVQMAAAGINKSALAAWGGRVCCEIANPEIAALAKAQGATRSETAILTAMSHAPGIIAIGNAPTALLTVIRHCEQHPEAFQGVIIGAPVGFVNAAESKEILAQQEIPHIVALGRKGGSPVAAAIVNALIRLAAEES
ncbi:MAG: precorrin-8X methylmutase [Desulfobulbaceae bacterium]|nr:precorrin-8X methylmutase [Desulfobulbaceae bacterium]